MTMRPRRAARQACEPPRRESRGVFTLPEPAKQSQNSFETQHLGHAALNEAADLKLRAEWRGGQLLKIRERNKGGRPPKKPDSKKTGSTVEPVLSDLGITKKQSHRWQLEAEVPEKTFEKFVAETKVKGEELTSRGLRQLSSRWQRMALVGASEGNYQERWQAAVADLEAQVARCERDGEAEEDDDV